MSKVLIRRILNHRVELSSVVTALNKTFMVYNQGEHKFNTKGNLLDMITYGIHGPTLSVVKEWLTFIK